MADYGGLALVIGALLGTGGLAAIFHARAQNRSTDAQTDVTLGQGWQTLVTEQRREINELRERVRLVEHQEEQCQERLALLEAGRHTKQAEERLANLIDQQLAQMKG